MVSEHKLVGLRCFYAAGIDKAELAPCKQSPVPGAHILGLALGTV